MTTILTSLVRRFVLDQFDDEYVSTMGAKVSKKEVLLPLSKNRRMRVDMMIWDVMGEKNVAELYTESQFKGVQGILAVADVTRRKALDSIDDWTSSVRPVTGNVPVHILASKMDLEDRFETERREVSKRSRSMGCPFMFTSAKTGRIVERALGEMARWILFANSKTEVPITAQ